MSVVVSLDGYLASCVGATAAFPPDRTGEPGFADFVASVDTLVMGRKAYEHLRLTAWWPGAGRRCVVFSRTRDGQREADAEFVAGDVVDVVTALQAMPGRGIW